jgi:sulfur carrier protein ThiS
MRVTVTVKGVTGLPTGSKDIELESQSTIEDLLRAFLAEQTQVPASMSTGIPTNLIVTHNGQYVPVSRFRTQQLSAGDEVTLIPLVVGG